MPLKVGGNVKVFFDFILCCSWRCTAIFLLWTCIHLGLSSSFPFCLFLLKTKLLSFSLHGQLLLLSPFLLCTFSFEPLSLPFPWPLSPVASALLPLLLCIYSLPSPLSTGLHVSRPPSTVPLPPFSAT